MRAIKNKKSSLPLAASARYDVALQMDLESLTRLFATTLSPDPNVRKAGELQIRQVSHLLIVCKVGKPDQYRQIAGQEGIVAALLQIVSTEGVDKFVFDASFIIPRMSTDDVVTVPLDRRVLSGSKIVSTPVMISIPLRFGRIVPRFLSLIVTRSNRLSSVYLPPPLPDLSPSNSPLLSKMLSYATSLKNGPTFSRRSISSWRAGIFVRSLQAARPVWN